MYRRLKKIISAGLAAAMFVGTLAVGAMPVQAAISSKVRVGFFESAFFHKNEAGKLSGYAYDYLQDLAAYADWEYEYVEGTWDDLTSMLEKGEIDILADVSKTEEREGKMLFTSEAMGVERYYIYAKEGNTSLMPEDNRSLNERKIGVQKDSFQESLLRDWGVDHGITFDVLHCRGDAELVRALESGEVDAVVGIDSFSTSTACFPVVELGKSDIYFAVNRYRQDIRMRLDSAMKSNFEVSPNYNNNLYDKYLEARLNRNLTREEMRWLLGHGTIRVGYRDNYMAFCGTDEEGNLIGMLKDYLEAGSTSFSNAHLSFEAVPFKNTQEALDALAAGEIDCVFPVSIGKSDEENIGIYKTQPVLSVGNYAVVRDPKDISGDHVRVAVNGGNPNYISFLENNFPTWEQVYYETTEDCMKGIARGEADCIIIATFRINSVERSMNRNGLTIAYLDTNLDMSFAVNRGDKQLYSILRKMIAIIPAETISESMLTYATDDRTITISDILEQNLWGTLGILLAIIVLISVLLVSSVINARRLNRSMEITALNSEILSSISIMYFRILRISLVDNLCEEITSGNDVHRLTGQNGSASEKLGEICDTIVSEEYKDIVREFFDLSTLPERLRHADTVEIEYHANDDNWHLARFVVKKRDENGDVTNLLYLSRLVSDQKRKENKFKQEILEAKGAAEAANAAKTTFLFNMSHDIRTPMNAIIGYSQLIRKSAENPEQVLYYQERIEQASALLLSLINNVLDMARIESGKMELNEEYLVAGDILSSLVTVFETKTHEKNITIHRSVTVQHKQIIGDATKLREIYSNLISNAIKYTPEGGSIYIMTKELPCKKEGYALFQSTIRDTGIGISEEFLPHIFDSFSRERNTTTSGIAGTGLGMAIVKKLVELMDGTIEVESKLGEGTRFTVTLMHKIAPSSVYEQHEQAQEEKEQIVFRGKRILMAEDNELNAEIATTLLEDVGFAVDRAEDGAICVDMLDKAAAGYYDVVLMDIQMPHMDGYKATQMIRQMEDKGKCTVPIIAMTANAFEEDKRNALEVGMNAHIAKPIDVELLMKTLQEILGEE